MGLRALVLSGDLVLPEALVTVSDGQSFTVRGLSPGDALALYYRHAGELSALFDQFVQAAEAGRAIEQGEVIEVGKTLVAGAPRIMAEIIALASGSDPATGSEPNSEARQVWEGDIAIALTLSAGVQVAALEQIFGLTFTSDMPPKKFIGLVLAMAKSAQAANPLPVT